MNTSDLRNTNLDSLFTAFEEHSKGLDDYLLPSTLMKCFEIHRRQELEKASLQFTWEFQSHLLAMMNELRGVADGKEYFDLLFDPAMYFTAEHTAWTDPPGRTILLPALNTQVVERLPADSPLVIMAEEEFARLLDLSETYKDQDMIGLARMAVAAYGDQTTGLMDRRASVRYLAVNASARIEDLWAAAPGVWTRTANRVVTLSDVTAELKERLWRDITLFVDSPLTDEDMKCYTEDLIKLFAFNTERFLLSGKTRHFAFCGVCQDRIADWVERSDMAGEQVRAEHGGELPQA